MYVLATSRQVNLEGFGRIALTGTRDEARQIGQLWTDQLTKGMQMALIQTKLREFRQQARQDWSQYKGGIKETDRIHERDPRQSNKSDYGL